MARPEDGYEPPIPQITMASGRSERIATVVACAALTGPTPVSMMRTSFDEARRSRRLAPSRAVATQMRILTTGVRQILPLTCRDDVAETDSFQKHARWLRGFCESFRNFKPGHSLCT